MCLQCIVDSKVVIESLFPNTPNGKYSYQLQVNDSIENEEWPKGWYGVVLCNDPEFVFPGPLEEENDDNWLDISERGLDMVDRNILSMRRAWQIVDSAISAGYNPKEEPFESWLIDYCAKRLKEK